MQPETSLLRWKLVHMISLPDELLVSEMEKMHREFAQRFIEDERDECMIRQFNDQEWGRLAIENDALDIHF